MKTTSDLVLARYANLMFTHSPKIKSDVILSGRRRYGACARGWASNDCWLRLCCVVRRMLYATVVFLASANLTMAVERVTARVGGENVNLFGQIIVEAQDGGLLLLAPDGVLWVVQPEELVNREANDAQFELHGPEKLATDLLAEFPYEFAVHDTQHYVICYNTSKAYARWCGALYERLYRGFMNYWKRRGFAVHDPPAPLVVLVFDGKAAYSDYARKELGDAVDSIIGYYSLRTNRVTTFDLTGLEELRRPGEQPRTTTRINQILSQPGARPTVATMIHEATHQLAFNCGLHRRYADIPLWVSEGLAVYFETPDLKSSKGWRGIGTLNRSRLAQFLQYSHRRGADSLATLLADDKRFRDPHQAPDAYAEAWALCYYLLNRYPKQFSEYVNVLADKEPLLYDRPEDRLAQFKRTFGEDLGQFDAAFTKYVQQLR